MKVINTITDVFKSFISILKEIIEGYNEISISNDKTNRDLESILSNAEDRAKYNETVQKLKDDRLKADGKKSEKVKFSDRTLTISID